MRRVIVMGLGVLLLIGLFASPASPGDRARHSEQPYSGGSDQFFFVHDCDEILEGGVSGPGLTVHFGTRKGEKSVDLQITDDVPGQTVVGAVSQRGRGGMRFFCGQTEGFPIKGGKRLSVTLYNGPTTQGLSIPTSGTVEAHFHR